MTTTSDLAIANDALINLGQDIPITALSSTATNKAARVLYNLFEAQRDILLSSHAWPFALIAEPLSIGGVAFPGWAYRYDYPDDCLNAIAVCDAGGLRDTMSAVMSSWCPENAPQWRDGRYAFSVVGDDSNKSIVSDLDDAYLIYVRQVTDTALWPVLVREALGRLLAWKAAPAIKGELGMKMQQQLMQLYDMARASAIAHAYNESHETRETITPGLAVRG